MPTKEWLDQVEKTARTLAEGPDIEQRDPEYWTKWGELIRDYGNLVTPKTVVDLVHAAKSAVSVMIDRDDLLRRDKRFNLTEYVIEADDDESLKMWQDWAIEGTEYGRKWDHRVDWKQELSSITVQVGELGTMPVVVCFTWAVVADSRMVFWYPTSQVVDYVLCERWIKKHFKNSRMITDDIQNCISEQIQRRAKHKKK